MSEYYERKFNHIFTWNIENFYSCILKEGDGLRSPLFTADSIEGTIWRLILYPLGYVNSTDDTVSCLLQRIRDDSNLEMAYCSFTIEIIGSNGKTVISKRKRELFSKEGFKCWIDFPKRSVFQDRSPRSYNNLTIKCCMKASTLPVKTTFSKNVAWTKICVDRCSFKWTIANLIGDVESKKFQCPAKSIYEISCQILEGDLVIHIIRLEMKILQQMAVCTIFLLDINDLECTTTTARHLFQPDCEVWEFPCFKEETLMVGNINCTINGIFSLRCDFSVSNGSIVQEIDDLYIPDLHPQPLPNVDALAVLQDDLSILFCSQKFADVRLRAHNETILAHKTILCARSPVFSAMFENNMIETKTGVVNVQDVEKHILKVFLKFLYTGTVENIEMSYDSAMKLLMVADKYQVTSLKDSCCCFLMETLSDENVCEVLDVADIVGHSPLKESAVNYIEENAETILQSDEWKMLVEKNLKLSTEIICKISANLGSARKKMRL